MEVIPYQLESGVLWAWEFGSEAELLFSTLDLSTDIIDDDFAPLIEQHTTKDTPQRKKRWFNL